MRKKIIWGILYFGGIVGVVIFFLSQPSSKELCYQQYEKEKNILYSGIVVDKYRDSTDHFDRKIELYKSTKILMEWDESGLYEFIQPNDSIVKDTGSYEVRVYRDSVEYKFVIDYGCDNLKNKLKVE